jgi:nicotinamide-nucleotide adenylyltransferase
MIHEPVPNPETGVIHGRFQVLHNDHRVYLLAGMALCRHLVVGITNPDPFLTRDEHADPKRSDPAANPLTYFERYVMVRSVLEEAGIESSRFSIVPFPINIPELYRYRSPRRLFFSPSTMIGEAEAGYFKSLGLMTHVLGEVSRDQKGSVPPICGAGWLGTTMEELVPSVAHLMKKWDIRPSQEYPATRMTLISRSSNLPFGSCNIPLPFSAFMVPVLPVILRTFGCTLSVRK